MLKKITLILLLLTFLSCTKKEDYVVVQFVDEEEYIFINQDSLDYLQFQKDSTNFRKMTRIINGGQNGFADRYNIWLRANNYFKDTI